MVKDSVLSLLWLRFSPWPRNFFMPQVQPKKKKKKKKRKKSTRNYLGRLVRWGPIRVM